MRLKAEQAKSETSHAGLDKMIDLVGGGGAMGLGWKDNLLNVLASQHAPIAHVVTNQILVLFFFEQMK